MNYAPITTAVLQAHELSNALDEDWHAGSTALSPGSMRLSAGDPLWRTRYVVARVGFQDVGLLALYQRKTSNFPADIFDPGNVAPKIFPEKHPANCYLLIGGSTELISGPAISKHLDSNMIEPVKTALVDSGFESARASGLVGAALYVRQADLSSYLGNRHYGRECESVGDYSVLMLPSGGWEAYLSSLGHKRRSIIRRDQRELKKLGLRAEVLPAIDVIEESAPLVLSIKRRHNIPDHQLLVEYRLSNWATNPVGQRFAFAVRDPKARLLAVSFACKHKHVLEMFEIGLVDDPEIRHLVYAEVLLYAPIFLALRTGCTQITLGLGSVTPKLLRGAVATKVWAVNDGRRPVITGE